MSCLLAFVLVVASFLSGFMLEIHRSYTHKKLKSEREKVCLEHLVLPVGEYPELLWMEEFDYNGNRYDVVSVETNDSVYVVRAVNDTKEKWLEQQVENSGNEQNSKVVVFKTEFLERISSLASPLASWLLIHTDSIYDIRAGFLTNRIKPPAVCVLA
jgi:hypothetical protein